MNVFVLLLILGTALILFGFIIDKLYKRKGITTDPKENERNISSSERIYTETMLNQVKVQNNNHPNL
ncbi:hypothetical protein [Bacillus methanolicus]|uniref:Uncharacterized protein n=1 Tax=Bacillus methanolicus (strain MGA3 / ATCC 53907) TaxID=796606 RepID=I3E365_BACMM|nr:hypothetical protein [Bacillus methanolicus]AIE58971.1 hypothetical protein BMMGA3_02535 [Bacillus methanolicus MGA3]EIJ80936.1 hypothetical protein MGA3_11595 [Bacillus methanolicus MGA3]